MGRCFLDILLSLDSRDGRLFFLLAGTFLLFSLESSWFTLLGFLSSFSIVMGALLGGVFSEVELFLSFQGSLSSGEDVWFIVGGCWL